MPTDHCCSDANGMKCAQTPRQIMRVVGQSERGDECGVRFMLEPNVLLMLLLLWWTTYTKSGVREKKIAASLLMDVKGAF